MLFRVFILNKLNFDENFKNRLKQAVVADILQR